MGGLPLEHVRRHVCVRSRRRQSRREMRRNLAVLLWCALPLAAAPRTIVDFDSDWRFFKGEPAPGFDDSTWRTVRVPHDWSIEGPFDEKNLTGQGGGFLPAGVGWYRKHFTAPANRRVFIEFDGVMANSEVSINGRLLGKRPYGYV